MIYNEIGLTPVSLESQQELKFEVRSIRLYYNTMTDLNTSEIFDFAISRLVIYHNQGPKMFENYENIYYKTKK